MSAEKHPSDPGRSWWDRLLEPRRPPARPEQPETGPYTVEDDERTLNEVVAMNLPRVTGAYTQRPIDSKYAIEARSSIDGVISIRIINMASGEAIPGDEPLFLFRGKDNLAPGALMSYRADCEHAGCDAKQVLGISRMIKRFLDWRSANPEKMKRPD